MLLNEKKAKKDCTKYWGKVSAERNTGSVLIHSLFCQFFFYERSQKMVYIWGGSLGKNAFVEGFAFVGFPKRNLPVVGFAEAKLSMLRARKSQGSHGKQVKLGRRSW